MLRFSLNLSKTFSASSRLPARRAFSGSQGNKIDEDINVKDRDPPTAVAKPVRYIDCNPLFIVVEKQTFQIEP